MANLKDRIFVVVGNDFDQRRLIIENIKSKILQKSKSPFSTLTFYAKEIDLKDLQEKVSLVSFDKNKILVFKNADSLKKEIKDFLIKDINKIISNNYLLFEMEKDYFLNDKGPGADKFLKFIFLNSAIFKAGRPVYQANFDSFKKSIRMGDLSSSLYVLNKLFEGKTSDTERKVLGLQIFGVLVSEVSYLKDKSLRQKYLSFLMEVDRMIKEKGMEPKFAIELFLAKSFTGPAS